MVCIVREFVGTLWKRASDVNNKGITSLIAQR